MLTFRQLSLIIRLLFGVNIKNTLINIYRAIQNYFPCLSIFFAPRSATFDICTKIIDASWGILVSDTTDGILGCGNNCKIKINE